MLDQARRSKLTLLTAGSGYGKTVALVGWLREKNHVAQWYTLDTLDNNPPRFHAYLIETMNGIDPELRQELRVYLEKSQEESFDEPMLAMAFKALADFGQDVFFIFDDFHHLTNPELLTELERMLEFAPANVHTILLGRQYPTLRLNRFRGQNQLLELRFEDLAFNRDEMLAWLKVRRPDLATVENANRLQEETEGWIVGAQLYLQAAPPPTDSKGRSAQPPQLALGRNRYVLSYFEEEVFAQLSEPAQRLLLHVSPVPKFCASLADALLGQTNSRECLEQLVRDSRFIVPLDVEDTWFRLHHLFAQFLNQRLTETEPDSLRKIQLETGRWLLANNAATEAVQVLILAGQLEQALEVIESQAENLIGNSLIRELKTWLDLIPHESFESHPRLWCYKATILFHENEYYATERLLRTIADKAERVLASGTDPTFEYVQSYVWRLLATLYAACGNIEEGLRYSALAEPYVTRPGISPFFVNSQLYNRGILAFLGGLFPEAAEVFHRLLLLAQQNGQPTFLAGAGFYLAQILYIQGQVHEALDLIDAFLNSLTTTNLNASVKHLPSILKVQILLEQGRLAEAQELLATVDARQATDVHHISLVYQHPILIRLYELQGLWSRAEQLIYEDLSKYPDPAFQRVKQAQLAGIYLKTGRIENATPWLAEALRGWTTDPATSVTWTLADDLLARTELRYLYHQGRFEEAVTKADALFARQESLGWTASAVETLNLAALALHKAKQEDEALNYVERSVQLAQAAHFVYLYVSEGNDMYRLLRRLDGKGIQYPFVRELLAVSTEFARTRDEEIALSYREIEVLTLLEQGLSMRQVADKLFVTTGTIKRHVHNAGQKLGVTSRKDLLVHYRKMTQKNS
jgi:LuxR family maltose regulon positive regulatory protein